MQCKIVNFSSQYFTNDYVSWLNDKNLTKYSEQRHSIHTLDSCKEYVKSFTNSDNLLFAIIDIKSKKHIGNINAYIDVNNKVADIGILISQGGKGYGLCAWNQMINLLFSSKHNMRKITAGTMAINEAMIKIFKKSGMKLEYIRPKHFIYEKKLVDMIGYYKENKLR